MTICPCGSGSDFDSCCGPYLRGERQAPTAEVLMRSRYTAYARNDMEYLARTWHPSKGLDAKRIRRMNAGELEWVGLEIKATEAGGAEDTEGTVEFVARYRLQDQDGQIREVSRFRKEKGVWYYLNGRVVNPNQVMNETPRPGRNDPCPCGSGKKYKKCCGA